MEAFKNLIGKDFYTVEGLVENLSDRIEEFEVTETVEIAMCIPVEGLFPWTEWETEVAESITSPEVYSLTNKGVRVLDVSYDEEGLVTVFVHEYTEEF